MGLMSSRLAALPLAVGLIGVTLAGLGTPALSSLLAALVWVLSGTVGAVFVNSFLFPVASRHWLLMVLGPGALVGIGISVLVFLVVRGGGVGYWAVGMLYLTGLLKWSSKSLSDVRTRSYSLVGNLLCLLGCALIANSDEFPNLLLSGIAISLFGAFISNSGHRIICLVLGLGSLLCLLVDWMTRPPYWWWSSDDLTTLSGVGTIIIQRGKVADVAGWPTSSHHWLLHAWLALWNEFSLSEIYLTYQISWPLLATTSLMASVWMFSEALLGRFLGGKQFLLVAFALAGLVRLDWSAPQEQQPFVFAMITCCYMWIRIRTHTPLVKNQSVLRRVTFLVSTIVVIPLFLYFAKPTLIVAYGLLVVGVALVYCELSQGKRILLRVTAMSLSVSGVLVMMALLQDAVSNRSFTSYRIDVFPGDLGWCVEASVFGSFACVISLKLQLTICGLLAALVIRWRSLGSRSDVLLLLLPLLAAYLPFRYFITSGVRSGAPSFYRLSEMGLMMLVIAGVIVVIGQRTRTWKLSLAVSPMLVIAVAAGRIDLIYDSADRILTRFPLTQFMSAFDVVAMTIVVVSAFIAVRVGSSARRVRDMILLSFTLLSLVPASQLIISTLEEKPAPERMERPDYLGPADIDLVGRWIRENTEFGTVLATNFLCPSDRLPECFDSNPQLSCQGRHPVLMASWALAALSKREFLYLSQGWTEDNLCREHHHSVQLGSTALPSDLHLLISEGVNYYVASRIHTNPTVWDSFARVAELRTANFLVVSLSRLINVLS